MAGKILTPGNLLDLSNTYHDFNAWYQNQTTSNFLVFSQDVAGLVFDLSQNDYLKGFLNGNLLQTNAVTLMYNISQYEAGTGSISDVIGSLGGLISSVGNVTDNPELVLAGALISASANYGSDLISTLSSLTDLLDNAINNGIQGAADSSTLANIVSGLLGNAQNQVIDPLVISTNGQAVTTTSLANGAFVDYQNTGFAEQSSWFSSNAAVLVDVTNAKGTLNNGFTIIGSSTTNQNGNKLGQAGFTQLATLDTNHDGVINASDTDFNQIEIWVGSNGQPGSGHLETLAQAGITSISLNSTAVNTTDANGDKTLATSTVTYGNGTTGTLSDMNMSINTSNTIDESAGTVNSAYANLPDVAGWGDVHNLQVAMALDTTGNLANLVKQYLAATPAEQPSLISNLIFTWTGVQNNSPEEAYHFTGDTREIDALSKFVGAQYSNNSGWSTTLVTMAGVPMVEAAWNQLVNYVSGCLLNYGTNQNLLTDVKLSYNPTTQSFTYDVSGLVNALSSMSTMQQLEFGTFLSGSSAYNGIVSALNAYYPSPSTLFQNTIATLGTTRQASVVVSSNDASLVLDSSTILSGSNDTVSVGTPVTLTLASGSGNTVTQSGNFINFFVQAANSSNTLSGNTGTFDVTAQATGDVLTLAGGGNTLTQTGGDAFGSVSVTGSSDTLNLTSTGVAVTVSGNSDTLNLGGSTITASNANSLTVNGNGNTIDTSGITTLNLSGDATLTGSNDTVNMGASTLTLANGSNDTITETVYHGTADVIEQAANTSTTIAGYYGIFDVTANATGDALTLAGYGNALNQTGGDAFSSVSVTGSEDTLDLTSTGAAVTVSGNGYYDTLDLTSSTVTASSTNYLTVNGNGNTVDTSGVANLTVNGNSSVIDATSGLTNLTVNGGSSTITASGVGTMNLTGSATLTGSNDTVNMGASTLTLASGSNDTITETVYHGTADVIEQAANTSTTIAGYYGIFDVTANATGDALTLAGYGNALNQTGGDAFGSVSVTGSYDTLNLTSSGVAVNVSSNYSTLNLTGDTVNDNNVSGLTVGGNSNTINVTGTTGLTINGNSDTINATGVTGLVVNGNATMNGSNNSVNMGSAATLTLANGSGANSFSVSNGASDTLAFGSDVTADQLWFSRSGNNLLITVDGTSETETVTNWFDSTYYQIGTVRDGSGDTISASGINSLVQAMASMTPPPSGQMNLSTTQQQQLAPVLAANWH